jgi:hypothetical protein
MNVSDRKPNIFGYFLAFCFAKMPHHNDDLNDLVFFWAKLIRQFECGQQAKEPIKGGQTLTVVAPLDIIPVYTRE